MSFSIATKENQAYSAIPYSAKIQEWDIPAQVKGVYIEGLPAPSTQNITVKIKDYISLFGSKYQSYKLRTYITYFNSGVQWLSVSGVPIGSDLNLTPGNLTLNLNIDFENCDLISPRATAESAFVNFKVIGVKSNGLEETLNTEGSVLKVNLHVVTSSSFYLFMPLGNVFDYILDGTQPTYKSIEVYGLATMVIYIPVTYDLKPHSDLSFLGQDSNADYNAYITSQDGTPLIIEVRPNATLRQEYENQSSESNKLTKEIYVTNLNKDNQKISLISYFYETASPFVEPAFLEFTSIKGVSEADLQALEIKVPGTWSIKAPAWVPSLSQTGSSYKKIENIRPINSSNFTKGFYQDQAVLTHTNGDDIIIPVIHKVVDRVDFNLEENDFNFTLDNSSETSVYELDQENNLLQIIARIENIAYNVPFYQITQYLFKTGFFKNKAVFHFGEVVERNTSRITVDEVKKLLADTRLLDTTNNNYQLIWYYNAFNANIALKVANKQDDSVIYQEENTFKFIRGRKPQLFNQRSAMLDPEPIPIRITPNGLILQNFLTAWLNVKLTIEQNDVKIKELESIVNTNVFGLSFQADTAMPGDIIKLTFEQSRSLQNLEFSINKPILEAVELKPAKFSQEYLVFPEGDYSNYIIWEDEYGVLRCFEFTGEFSFETEYEFTEEESKKDLVFLLRNLKVAKTQNFTINSGHIPKSNSFWIDSIIDAGIVFLLDKENQKLIELKPLSKKLNNSSAAAAIYDYSVEFKINPEHARKIYS